MSSAIPVAKENVVFTMFVSLFQGHKQLKMKPHSSIDLAKLVAAS